jgi:hypothetical protein
MEQPDVDDVPGGQKLIGNRHAIQRTYASNSGISFSQSSTSSRLTSQPSVAFAALLTGASRMGGTLTSILRPSILISSTKAAVDQARGLIYRPSTSRICSRSQSHSARITASLPRSVCASFSMGIARIMCSLEHIRAITKKFHANNRSP